MGSQTKIFSMFLRSKYIPGNKKVAVNNDVRDILRYALLSLSKGILQIPQIPVTRGRLRKHVAYGQSIP